MRRSWPCARRPRPLGSWRLDRAHPGRHPGALHHVRRSAGAGPGGPLVFGAYDPKAGAVASLFDVVRDPRLNHRVDVRGGILEAECGAAAHATSSPRADRSASPRSPPRPERISSAAPAFGIVLRGGVSERPKEHASKACEVKASEGSNPSATAKLTSRLPCAKIVRNLAGQARNRVVTREDGPIAVRSPKAGVQVRILLGAHRLTRPIGHLTRRNAQCQCSIMTGHYRP